ncbi:MAG: TIGR02117 family protein [Pirellulaceae bacterium]
MKWGFRLILLAMLLYAAIVLVGLIPVNNDFEPTADGVEIHVISNAVHADLVMPIEAAGVDWRERFPAACFRGDTADATHVAIGWGDRGFFLETPTWADLKASTTANALLWPSDSCMHVRLTKLNYLAEDARSVRISPEQYGRLVEHIRSTFVQNGDGSFLPIAGAHYGQHDAFFAARGAYHGLNTCNSWAGRGLRSAGVRTGWLTPLPKTVYWYLPDS